MGRKEMTFLLSEDKALREALQGMVVTDQKAEGEEVNRPVGVWFGQPDQEIRAQNYPYVTIEMLSVTRDPSREVRGIVAPEYLKPENLDEENFGFKTHYPIPVMIDYQITTFARHPRHDRQIIAQLVYERLPLRFGVLQLDDGTVRRLDVMDVSKRDKTEQAKRLFVNTVTVRVSSEVLQGQITEVQKVLQVSVYGVTAENAGGRPGDPDYYPIESFTITP
jgi:hypothetical protein